MRDIKLFREYVMELTNYVNSKSDSKIDKTILAVREEHITKKLNQQTGICLCVSYPDEEGTIQSDNNSNDLQVFFFLCKKVNQGTQTEEDEVEFYAKIQSIMNVLKDRIISNEFTCSDSFHPTDKYKLEWEYQIFGGYNGMSLGIKYKDYD